MALVTPRQGYSKPLDLPLERRYVDRRGEPKGVIAGFVAAAREIRKRIAPHIAKAGLYDGAMAAMRWLYDRRIQGSSVLPSERYFLNARRLEAAWAGIRDEALTIADKLQLVPRFHELMPEQRSISANDGRDWRLFVLKAYGADVAANQRRCPQTVALLKSCPEVLSASFSFLAPGKHVPEHRGPFRGVLRYHLGLSMPRDELGRLGAVLWVDGVQHRLTDGGSLLWDDTFPHEVRNDTNGVRIALLLDVWRRGMPADMALLSRLVVGAVWIAMRMRKVAFAAATGRSMRPRLARRAKSPDAGPFRQACTARETHRRSPDGRSAVGSAHFDGTLTGPDGTWCGAETGALTPHG
jgi:aspartate beta-hydroxylase